MNRSRFDLLFYALAALAVGAPRLAGQTTTGSAPPDASGNVSAPLPVDAPRAQRGEKLWRKHKCGECHSFTGEAMIGPNLHGIVQRRPLAWLRRWLRDTDHMLQTDSIAITLLAAFGGVRMPTHALSEREIDELVHYLARESERVDSR